VLSARREQTSTGDNRHYLHSGWLDRRLSRLGRLGLGAFLQVNWLSLAVRTGCGWRRAVGDVPTLVPTPLAAAGSVDDARAALLR